MSRETNFFKTFTKKLDNSKSYITTSKADNCLINDLTIDSVITSKLELKELIKELNIIDLYESFVKDGKPSPIEQWNEFMKPSEEKEAELSSTDKTRLYDVMFGDEEENVNLKECNELIKQVQNDKQNEAKEKVYKKFPKLMSLIEDVKSGKIDNLAKMLKNKQKLVSNNGKTPKYGNGTD